MGRLPTHGSSEQAQNDPGESNDPKSSNGQYDLHILTSLTQIFDRLGKIDQKIEYLSTESIKLKTSVEKHDKLILRGIFTVTGAIGVIVALWFIYENFLKDHLTYK